MLTYYIVANYHAMSHHTLYSVQCSYLKIDFGLIHWLLTRLGPRYNLPNRAHPLCQPLGAIWWTHLSTTPGYWFSRAPYCERKWPEDEEHTLLPLLPRGGNPKTSKNYMLSQGKNGIPILVIWNFHVHCHYERCNSSRGLELARGGEIIPIEYWKKTYAIISTLFRVILLLRNIPSSVIETMWPENSGRIFQWRGPDLGKIKW